MKPYREAVEGMLERMRERAAEAELYKSQAAKLSHQLLEAQTQLSLAQQHLQEGRESKQLLESSLFKEIAKERESKQHLEAALASEREQRMQVEAKVVAVLQLLRMKEVELRVV
ncbi:hypothetical protein CLOM_g22180 [Closterium sp. NIES-68]|nr:hypothetical protein CLOM_g22180 [Closterium sp. NIES-68]